jgi:hypothetical protein
MKLNIWAIAVGFLVIYIAYKLYSDSDFLHLKCAVSDVDGNSYCVRDRETFDNAVDLLAYNTQKMKKLVASMDSKYPHDPNVRRLVQGFNPQKIVETLPTSEHTAYSENKGEKLAFCLNAEEDNDKNLIDANTLFFVSAHEMAHIATKSVGHTPEFWANFKLILENAVEDKLYTPVDYSKKPKSYCGMEITDSPLFT